MSDNQSNCAYHYTVKRGDSFYLIAQRLSVQLRDLLEANPDIPPARLTIGDVLCIPYCSTANTPAGENECCPTPQPGGGTGEGGSQPGGETPYACAPNRRAVVQEGQTAKDLLLRYNLSYHTLKTANSDKDIEALKGGDVVCVPAQNIACPLPVTVTLGVGETLESVATKYQVPIAALLRVNPCLSPAEFVPGATVRLPD